MKLQEIAATPLYGHGRFIYNPPLSLILHGVHLFFPAVREEEKTRALGHIPTARFIRRDVTGTILHPAE